MSRGLRIGFNLDASNTALQVSCGKYGVLAPRATLISPSGPSLGAHNKVVMIDGSGTTPATITANTSSAGGSVFVLPGFASFGDLATPTDNKGNTYTQRGTDQSYAGGLWPGFGLRTYSAAGTGGTGHTTSVTKTATTEFSQALIEVLNATTVAVTQGSAAAPGQGVSYSSPSITVSAPAVLISCWTGDAGVSTPDQSVAPSAGWTLLEFSFQANTAYVQFATAYKVVTAGTYSHTWLPATNQGAAMMMIAVT